MTQDPGHRRFMQRAIELSIQNVKSGRGGPFGAVIVKDGKVIGEGVNQVTSLGDPTAHAEVNAIRAACKKIRDFSLQGSTLYTSCEPCPMCLGAIYWSRLDRVFFGNTKADAAAIEFDDAFIYQELDLPLEKRNLKMEQLGRDEAIEAFQLWQKSTNKIEY